MLPDVFALLNVSAVRAFVGSSPPRIFRHGVAPQGVTAPYITWFVVTDVPENHLDGTPPVDFVQVQVDCWSANTGDGGVQINLLAAAVRAQIETAHDVTDGGDGHDPTTDRFRVTISFLWLLNR